jgi:hypothetical protein
MRLCHYGLDFIGRQKRQSLRTDSPEESQVSAVLLLELLWRYGQCVQLHRLPHIHPNVNQVRQYLGDVTARVKPEVLACPFADFKQLGVSWLQVLAPQLGVDHHPSLGGKIVGQVQDVKIIAQCIHQALNVFGSEVKYTTFAAS